MNLLFRTEVVSKCVLKPFGESREATAQEASEQQAEWLPERMLEGTLLVANNNFYTRCQLD